MSENTLYNKIFIFLQKATLNITLTASGMNNIEPKTKGPYGLGQLVHANDT